LRDGAVVGFGLPTRSRSSLIVYNALGQEVRILLEGEWARGNHTVVWDGRSSAGEKAPNGTYFLAYSFKPLDGTAEHTGTTKFIITH
jgi:flagellar hook assembly protein FlgD